jgi:DNA repair exonuclease SbcCD ATPase subunit
MKLCTTCDIAYNSPECPVCQATKFLEEKDKELALKEEKIWNLEGKVADLDYQLEQCQKGED